MKLISTTCYKYVAAHLYCIVLVINVLNGQQASVCPIGVPMEQPSKKDTSFIANTNEVYFAPFITWQQRANSIKSDDKYTKLVLPGLKTSRKLLGNRLGFKIPAGATINGIELQIEGSAKNAQLIDEVEVMLLGSDGEPKGSNKANQAKYQKSWIAKADSTDRVWTYGSKNDTWGSTWTAAQINNANFGYQIQIRNIHLDTIVALLDNIQIIVHYTPVYSFCDAMCLTFYIDKYEEMGRYEWRVPEGFYMVSASTSYQAIDLKITHATYGIYDICVDVYDKSDAFVETCCRPFAYLNCQNSIISGISWQDSNGNQIRDTSDQILSMVELQLFGVNGQAIANTTTDSEGKYIFDNIPPGDYYIKASQVDNHLYVLQVANQPTIDSDITNAFGLGTTGVITAVGNNTIANVDFGYSPLVGVGDFVWVDKNFNGMQDSAEVGLPGVKVFLYTSIGQLLDSTITNTTGHYRFDSLEIGSYYLQFVTPVDYLITTKRPQNNWTNSDIDSTGRTEVFTLTVPGIKRDIDAGYYQKANIGDFVWEDMNGNGIYEAGEPPLGGIVVRLQGLTGSNTPVSLTSTSNAMGRYSFNGISPGTYTLTFEPLARYMFTLPNQGDDESLDSDVIDGKISNIMVCSGDVNMKLDAGLYRNGCLGDFVWEDINGDGIQNNGEPGIGSIGVVLTEIRRDLLLIIDTIYTDENGKYLFEDIKPGNYKIDFIYPDSLYSTLGNVGTIDTLDSDAIGEVISPILLISGQKDFTQDFGLLKYSSIGDYIWLDKNTNGIQDIEESGVEGIAVHLSGVDYSGAIIDTTLDSDSNGKYTFHKLKVGTYVLQIVVDTQYIFTTSDVGTDDAIDSDGVNGLVSNISLNSGVHITNLDFGLVSAITIGDFVWEDANLNGLQDSGELGLPNVSVLLNGTSISGVNVVRQVLTDENGRYEFATVFPGEYSISLVRPQGYFPTKSGAGSDINIDSNLPQNGSDLDISIQNLTDDLSYDFGLVRSGSIGDFVWEDLDCNGVFDSNESGLPGVEINLRGLTFLNEFVFQSTTSDADGNYLFTNLLPGEYQLDFVAPSGYMFSAAMITAVELGNGEMKLGIDAPFFRFASIGNFVWNDNNENGLQDIGEAGISAIEVVLRSVDFAQQLEFTTVTDVNGFYQFDSLKPGKYVAQFTLPVNYKATIQNEGNDGTKDSDIDTLGNTLPIVVISGEQYMDLDAGLLTLASASISGLVWEDLDALGIREGNEVGVAGIEIQLAGTTTMNMPINAIAITGVDGSYTFDNLMPGDYTLELVNLGEYNVSLQNQGNDETVDSDFDEITQKVNVSISTPDEQITSIDGGLFRFGSIGDFVWMDDNGDGLQSPAEIGVANVNLSLYDTMGEIIGATISDDDGYYTFTGLRPGEYQVSTDIVDSLVQVDIVAGFETSNSDFSEQNGLVVTNTITLISGENNLDIDLGLKSSKGNISGMVWSDDNGNGLNDEGEDPVDGITVYLLSSQGDTLLSTVTDSLGQYIFATIMSGIYIIDFEKIDTLLFTYPKVGSNETIDSDVLDKLVGKTDLITLPKAGSIDNIDAGLVQYSCIGDYVWVDANENGLQDSDENGLNGIKVWLIDEGGVIIDSTVTTMINSPASSGFYNFTSVLYGNYKVKFHKPANFSYTENVLTDLNTNSDVIDTTGGLTAVFALLPNEQKKDIDAGFTILAAPPGSIAGLAWEDKNNNKVRENNEPLLAGINIELKSPTGTVINTVVTDNNGSYVFNNVDFGDYFLSVEEIDSFLYVPNIMIDLPNDSDFSDDFGIGSTRLLTVFPGMQLSNIDLGFAQKITIGDFVFGDLNNNGLQDIGEQGISGVSITLYNEAGIVERTTVSTALGMYTFDEIAVGRYSLQFSKLPDYVFAKQDTGNDMLDSDADKNGLVSLRDFLVSKTYNDIDVGYVQSSSIGNNVWLDLNGNGVFNANEPGISNVRVRLYTSNGVQVDSTLTGINPEGNFNGYYIFKNVVPGDYYIQFLIPNGYLNSPPDVVDENIDSDVTGANGINTTDIFTVGIGVNLVDIDAGAYQPATLGDRVWIDTNQNGTQDTGEIGVPDVMVSLFTQAGTLVATTVTDELGLYSFDSLRQRLYYLQFQLPDGYEFTEQFASGNSATDSDVDNTGTTPLISLAHGSTLLDVDAGIIVSSNNIVMGTVWNDINEDGIRVETEKLMPLIDVGLYNSLGDLVLSATTNHAGMYCLSYKNNGDYHVKVEAPGQHAFSVKHAGNNPNKDSDVNLNGTSDNLQFKNTYTMNNVDAGFFYKAKSSINGFVWFDHNDNQIVDVSDSLMENILILLFDKYGVFVKSTKTDDLGQYAFNNLDAGEYYAKLPEIANMDFVLFTGANQDKDSEITGQYGKGSSRLLTIGTGQTFNNFDFGYYPISGLLSEGEFRRIADPIEVYPNPSVWFIDVKSRLEGANNNYVIYDDFGRVVHKGVLAEDVTRIELSDLKTGNYTLVVIDGTTVHRSRFTRVDNW